MLKNEIGVKDLDMFDKEPISQFDAEESDDDETDESYENDIEFYVRL